MFGPCSKSVDPTMRKILGFSLSVLLAAVFWVGCTGDAPPNPCTGVQLDIIFAATPSIGSSNNGTISVFNPAGDSVSYKLDNGPFQSSGLFSNLAPGNYIITVRNNRGCIDTAQATILNYGPRYAQVKQIVSGYCGPCHLNAGNSGNINFDTDARIVGAWQRIKVRCVDGTPSFMPQGGQLTTIDKQRITDWINAGHRISD